MYNVRIWRSLVKWFSSFSSESYMNVTNTTQLLWNIWSQFSITNIEKKDFSMFILLSLSPTQTKTQSPKSCVYHPLVVSSDNVTKKNQTNIHGNAMKKTQLQKVCVTLRFSAVITLTASTYVAAALSHSIRPEPCHCAAAGIWWWPLLSTIWLYFSHLFEESRKSTHHLPLRYPLHTNTHKSYVHMWHAPAHICPTCMISCTHTHTQLI